MGGPLRFWTSSLHITHIVCIEILLVYKTIFAVQIILLLIYLAKNALYYQFLLFGVRLSILYRRPSSGSHTQCQNFSLAISLPSL